MKCGFCGATGEKVDRLQHTQTECIDKLVIRVEKAEARVAELEKTVADERERAASCCVYLAEMLENGAGDYPKGARLRQAVRMIKGGDDKRHLMRAADSVSTAQVDETGGFRLGQLVRSVAHPNEVFVVTFAGRHHEGPPILTVRHFDDPNMQFFDVQANFSSLPKRPPLIVGGVEAGVAQTGGERPGASPVTSASAAQAVVEQQPNLQVSGKNPDSRFDSASGDHHPECAWLPGEDASLCSCAGLGRGKRPSKVRLNPGVRVRLIGVPDSVGTVDGWCGPTSVTVQWDAGHRNVIAAAALEPCPTCCTPYAAGGWHSDDCKQQQPPANPCDVSSARQLCDGCNAPMPGPHLAGEPELDSPSFVSAGHVALAARGYERINGPRSSEALPHTCSPPMVDGMVVGSAWACPRCLAHHLLGDDGLWTLRTGNVESATEPGPDLGSRRSQEHVLGGWNPSSGSVDQRALYVTIKGVRHHFWRDEAERAMAELRAALGDHEPPARDWTLHDVDIANAKARIAVLEEENRVLIASLRTLGVAERQTDDAQDSNEAPLKIRFSPDDPCYFGTPCSHPSCKDTIGVSRDKEGRPWCDLHHELSERRTDKVQAAKLCPAETCIRDDEHRTYPCDQSEGHAGVHTFRRVEVEWTDETTTYPEPGALTPNEETMVYVANYVDEWRNHDQASHALCHLQDLFDKRRAARMDYVQSAADLEIDQRNEGYEIPAPVALSSGEVCTVIQRELDRATDATRDGLLVALNTVMVLTTKRGALREQRTAKAKADGNG